MCITAADDKSQNLSQFFSQCNDFIHAARLNGGNVLIHWYVSAAPVYLCTRNDLV